MPAPGLAGFMQGFTPTFAASFQPMMQQRMSQMHSDRARAEQLAAQAAQRQQQAGQFSQTMDFRKQQAQAEAQRAAAALSQKRQMSMQRMGHERDLAQGSRTAAMERTKAQIKGRHGLQGAKFKQEEKSAIQDFMFQVSQKPEMQTPENLRKVKFFGDQGFRPVPSKRGVQRVNPQTHEQKVELARVKAGGRIAGKPGYETGLDEETEQIRMRAARQLLADIESGRAGQKEIDEFEQMIGGSE